MLLKVNVKVMCLELCSDEKTAVKLSSNNLRKRSVKNSAFFVLVFCRFCFEQCPSLFFAENPLQEKKNVVYYLLLWVVLPKGLTICNQRLGEDCVKQ